MQAIFNEWLIHKDNWKPIIHRSASSQQHSIDLQTFEGGSRIARFNLDDNLAARINTAFGEQLPSVLNQDWIDVSLLEDQLSGAPLTVANFERYVEENKYTDVILHRLVAGFVLQGGGFQDETSRSRTQHRNMKIFSDF